MANDYCSYSYSCVYEHIYRNQSDPNARRLMFRDPGYKYLADYSFRDRTSSVEKDMAAGKILHAYDQRTFNTDPFLYMRWATGYLNLTEIGYGGGASGNDKVDYLWIKQI